MLTRRDLTRLFVRVFGLIILVSAVVALPMEITGFSFQLRGLEAGNATHTWQTVAVLGIGHFGPFAIRATLGLCFLWWSGRIVNRASLAPEQDEVIKAADLQNIQITLVAVLGLYFIVSGFAELCRWSFGRGFNYSASGSLSLIWNWDLNIPLFVEALVKLIIGILLVLGRGASVAMRRRVHAWVRRWRTWSPFMPPNFDSQQQ